MEVVRGDGFYFTVHKQHFSIHADGPSMMVVVVVAEDSFGDAHEKLCLLIWFLICLLSQIRVFTTHHEGHPSVIILA